MEEEFLACFLVDARGGTLRSKRIPGFRLIVPPNAVEKPTRIFARSSNAKNQPKLFDCEAAATPVIELSPTLFKVNVVLDIPVLGEHRSNTEMVVLRSSMDSKWYPLEEQELDIDGFEKEDSSLLESCDFKRLRLQKLPQFLFIHTRPQVVALNVTPAGGTLSAIDERLRVTFPEGALTKPTTVIGQPFRKIQSFPVPAEACPAGVLTSPVLTLEPRRRRFHRTVIYNLPKPPEIGNLDEYHTRVLCSITEGNEPVMWKDVTNSVDIIWHKDVAMFSGNVSGRFWLIFLEKDSPAGSIADIIPVANRIYSKITKTRYRAGISAKITSSNDVEVKFISNSSSSVDLCLGETFSCELLNEENHVIKSFHNAIPFKPFQELSFSLKQFTSFTQQLPNFKAENQEKESKMKSESRKSTSLQTLGIFSLGLVLRIATLSLDIQDRPELNSPSQSYAQISEERYSANQSFIAKSIKYIFQNDLSWVVFLAIVDFVTCFVLSNKIEKDSRNDEEKRIIILAWCYLNPLSILSAGGCSAGIISNALLTCLWHCSINHKDVIGSLLLVLSSADRLYPLQLIVPILMLKQGLHAKAKYLFLVVFWSSLVWFTVGSEMFSNWNVIFNLTIYEPGLNCSWYMLIELFDHFRDFFVQILQVNAFCYVLPLCARYETPVVFKYLIPLLSIITPYATLSDFALLLQVLPLFATGKRRLFGILVLVVSLALCPVMWHLWIVLGSANANFYFAATLAVVAGAVILITDGLFAELVLMSKIMKIEEDLEIRAPIVIGAIVCKLDRHKNIIRRGYIAMLAVDKRYRKRGIGKELVRRAIEAMDAEGCDEVVLETEITNLGALRLYERLGFVRDERLFQYYLNGVDAFRLKLWLR
ncbi:Oidioi.mRNA.OKI2018_I69.chr1.g3371.t1.cds [Oikopleura dioica]|uniref:Oidioi.mRNA.OKI2018_I69.chr1.g3371.t1.cds n=1 Tax=Oikopleura dioica TaxID=34765 RepID=A0ABN7SXF5_OIKDI|nr:Oidioi.mRNA.OKI2018_I69.chr1.g3371.t1.cds [Oikopleura dioica]